MDKPVCQQKVIVVSVLKLETMYTCRMMKDNFNLKKDKSILG